METAHVFFRRIPVFVRPSHHSVSQGFARPLRERPTAQPPNRPSLTSLRGKLAKLAEDEMRLLQDRIFKEGTLVQKHISARTLGVADDGAARQVRLEYERSRSDRREDWYGNLTDEERTVFDEYCLKTVKSLAGSRSLLDLPRLLHAPFCRLALEHARIIREYEAARDEKKKQLVAQGNANLTIVACFINRLNEDEKAAVARLEGRWLRELSPEQARAVEPRSAGQPAEEPATDKINDATGASGPAALAVEMGSQGAVRLPTMLSAKDLAAHVGKSPDAVESFLRRYRKKYIDCFIATDSPRRNEPKYLYRIGDVIPALEQHFQK